MTKPVASIPKKTRIHIPDTMHKALVQRGMPRDVFSHRPFDLSQYVTSISSSVEGLKTRKAPKLVQLSQWADTLAAPFAKPYLYVIASSPNDGKAKQVAACLMAYALEAQGRGVFPRSTRSRQMPLWHIVTGAWADALRDAKPGTTRPSLLVLSNVTKESTPQKLEKLRDILELHNDTPRVLVITGTDPFTFVNTQLRMPVHRVMMLATARKVQL